MESGALFQVFGAWTAVMGFERRWRLAKLQWSSPAFEQRVWDQHYYGFFCYCKSIFNGNSVGDFNIKTHTIDYRKIIIFG